MLSDVRAWPFNDYTHPIKLCPAEFQRGTRTPVAAAAAAAVYMSV